MKKIIRCRHCESNINLNFLDLGFSPPSNAYIRNLDDLEYEKYYPLKVNVCEECWLVQTEDFANAEELFNSDYAYFSSCLLYTSPSPRDGLLSRMPSSA